MILDKYTRTFSVYSHGYSKNASFSIDLSSNISNVLACIRISHWNERGCAFYCIPYSARRGEILVKVIRDRQLYIFKFTIVSGSAVVADLAGARANFSC